MKCKVINHTKEDTNLLRKFTKIVAKHKGITDNIEIIFWKSAVRLHGRAYVGSVIYTDSDREMRRESLGWHKSLSVWLPDNWKTEKLKDVLQIMHHEFSHTLGIHHKDMMNTDKIEISEAEIQEVKQLLGVD